MFWKNVIISAARYASVTFDTAHTLLDIDDDDIALLYHAYSKVIR